MQLTALAALAVLAHVACAVPTASNYVIHEKREAATTWIKRRAVPASQPLPVRIGLTQRNLDAGHDMLMDVASHDSRNYGKWYSEKQIHDLFAPSHDTVTAVRTWLATHGITHASQSYNKQWLQFDIAAEQLEELLATKYYEFEHPETGVVYPACDEYHVPLDIQHHIDYITPGIKLSAAGQTSARQLTKRNILATTGPIHEGSPTVEVLAKARASNLTYCDEIVTPACIMAFYNLTRGTTAVAGNQLGIFETSEQYYSQADLNDYFGLFASYVPIGTKPKLTGVDGGGSHGTIPAAPADAGDEADLDFESSIPLVYPQSTVLWQVDDPYYEANGTYSGFLNDLWDAMDGSYCTYSAFGETGNAPIDPAYPDNHTLGYKHKLQCGAYTPTNVISISYHAIENLLPVNYQRRACNEIMKLSMQGVTVVASSGDHGVQENRGGAYCIGGKIFAPQFPVTCPYTLAVGATVLPLGKKDPTKDNEIAVTRFASGGGFSNIFAQPSYQSGAVDKFFSKHEPGYPYYNTTNNATTGANGGLYNRGGRGYPDVAAIGDNFISIIGGKQELIGGTSLSAPVFASILTRINEERLLAGKSTVGFVQPALYANPSMFHDITKGTNPGCNTTGFASVAGWDPVTGLGTPKYDQMLQYFLSLP